jgi:exosortase A-associated hydrolase 1
MPGAVEQPVVFACDAQQLVGIVHLPAAVKRVGVVIVVGGPSYRVGSHRQFVLLARRLAASGYAVMRFDYRGMGDSGGEPRSFEDLGDDIAAATRCLRSRVPQLGGVVLWGLCDAATGICLALRSLPDVVGVALLNPWVRAEQTLARSYVKHYYVTRITSPDFWRKALTGRLDYLASLRGAGAKVRRAFSHHRGAHGGERGTLAERLVAGLAASAIPVLVILSGKDLTAAEFLEAMRDGDRWPKIGANGRLTRRDLEEANHTFSSYRWRAQVEDWTVDWLESLCAKS